MELNILTEESKTISGESGTAKHVLFSSLMTPAEYKELVTASDPQGNIKVVVKK